jgi:Malic enzyme, NAD binding domain
MRWIPWKSLSTATSRGCRVVNEQIDNRVGLLAEKPRRRADPSNYSDSGTFTRWVVEPMSESNERPVILALSNPSEHAECIFEQAYSWSKAYPYVSRALSTDAGSM